MPRRLRSIRLYFPVASWTLGPMKASPGCTTSRSLVFHKRHYAAWFSSAKIVLPFWRPRALATTIGSLSVPAFGLGESKGCAKLCHIGSLIYDLCLFREITLRLTAVRECFEEVGLLLCRSRSQLDFGAVTCAQAVPDLESWQRRVHNKPAEFLTLCRELNVVPDLWALHEWSAWASPGFIRKGWVWGHKKIINESLISLLSNLKKVW